MRVSDANPDAWIPPPLPGDAICALLGGVPWQPADHLHSGEGAELAELRARPLLFGAPRRRATSGRRGRRPPLAADAYERWLGAWPAAVRSWSGLPYTELASSPAHDTRGRSFAHAATDWGPCRRSAPRSLAPTHGSARASTETTHSPTRGGAAEAARCTDAISGRDLPTGTACVGPLYAVATRWARNPAGDPPWLVISETHRDPLAADGPTEFNRVIAGTEWGRIPYPPQRLRAAASSVRSRVPTTLAADRAPPRSHRLATTVSTTPPPQWTLPRRPRASGSASPICLTPQRLSS